MRKFSFDRCAVRDGLRPGLQALFDRLAIDPYAELFVRSDGITQAGPEGQALVHRGGDVPARSATH
jgi:hypothetical protein